MTVNRYLRLIAGFFVMLSVALAHLHTPHWLWFTAFRRRSTCSRAPSPTGAR